MRKFQHLLLSLVLIQPRPGLPEEFAAIPPIPRVLPPLGVAVDGAELLGKVKKLRSEMLAVKDEPLLPDVEVYVEAVALAVENQEFEKPGDVAIALEFLATAEKRLAELKAQRPSWPSQHGFVIRGFRSAVDGSAQPFGVEIPADHDFKKSPAAYVWLHGRNDKQTNLYFLRHHEKKGGQFTPPAGTVQIFPFGRHCVGFKSAGGVDVLECVTAAGKMYRIDPSRVALMGFSMGGAGAWLLGAQHAERWAVVHAGAGFVDVRRYQNLDPNTVPLWERTLWGVNDVPDYARNLLNLPLVAYSGAEDKQKAAADIMEATLQEHGLALRHIIGPKMGHKYSPAEQKAVQEFIDAALSKGKPAARQQIHLQTKSLRHARLDWLQIEQLGTHWQDARVDAKIDRGQLFLKTLNCTALSFPDTFQGKQAEIDGAKLMLTEPFLIKRNSQWVSAPKSSLPALRKRPGLQGPMDDVLLDPFLVVLPSKNSPHPLVERWVKFESARFEKFWREVFRGRLRMKSDAAVTPDDLRQFHLILWGDAHSNTLIARIQDQLPISSRAGKIAVGKMSFESSTHVAAMIYPNPLASDHYVVLNHGCSFREAHCKTNSQQNPKLPDWAIFDLTQLPNATTAGKVVAADFFDEFWQLKP